MKRLLDHDPASGTTEIFNYNELTGDVTVETWQDCTPIVEDNKSLQDDDNYTSEGIKNDMWHYARIPNVVQLKWLLKYGVENDPMKKGNEKLLFSLLNDPEWKYLKTTNKIHKA